MHRLNRQPEVSTQGLALDLIDFDYLKREQLDKFGEEILQVDPQSNSSSLSITSRHPDKNETRDLETLENQISQIKRRKQR